MKLATCLRANKNFWDGCKEDVPPLSAPLPKIREDRIITQDSRRLFKPFPPPPAPIRRGTSESVVNTRIDGPTYAAFTRFMRFQYKYPGMPTATIRAPQKASVGL